MKWRVRWRKEKKTIYHIPSIKRIYRNNNWGIYYVTFYLISHCRLTSRKFDVNVLHDGSRYGYLLVLHCKSRKTINFLLELVATWCLSVQCTILYAHVQYDMYNCTLHCFFVLFRFFCLHILLYWLIIVSWR